MRAARVRQRKPAAKEASAESAVYLAKWALYEVAALSTAPAPDVTYAQRVFLVGAFLLVVLVCTVVFFQSSFATKWAYLISFVLMLKHGTKDTLKEVADDFFDSLVPKKRKPRPVFSSLTTLGLDSDLSRAEQDGATRASQCRTLRDAGLTNAVLIREASLDLLVPALGDADKAEKLQQALKADQSVIFIHLETDNGEALREPVLRFDCKRDKVTPALIIEGLNDYLDETVIRKKGFFLRLLGDDYFATNTAFTQDQFDKLENGKTYLVPRMLQIEGQGKVFDPTPCNDDFRNSLLLCSLSYDVGSKLSEGETDVQKLTSNLQMMLKDEGKRTLTSGEVGITENQLYIIAWDEENGAAYMAFPGTASMIDVRTDFKILGGGRKLGGASIHAGFFERAKDVDVSTIYGRLQSTWRRKCKERGSGPKEFRFVVTGHSLGGAVAHITLAILIHELNGNFGTNCHAFSLTYGAPYWTDSNFRGYCEALKKPWIERPLNDLFVTVVNHGDPVVHSLDLENGQQNAKNLLEHESVRAIAALAEALFGKNKTYNKLKGYAQTVGSKLPEVVSAIQRIVPAYAPVGFYIELRDDGENVEVRMGTSEVWEVADPAKHKLDIYARVCEQWMLAQQDQVL